jgi:hypothetical protein
LPVAGTAYDPGSGLALHVVDDSGREWVLIPAGEYASTTIPGPTVKIPNAFYTTKKSHDFDPIGLIMPNSPEAPPYAEGIPYRLPSEAQMNAMATFFPDMDGSDALHVFLFMNRVVREP